MNNNIKKYILQHRDWIRYRVSDDETDEIDSVRSRSPLRSPPRKSSPVRDHSEDEDSITYEEEEEEQEEEEQLESHNQPAGYYAILDDLVKKWMEIHLTRNVSLSATYEFWKVAMSTFPHLMPVSYTHLTLPTIYSV